MQQNSLGLIVARVSHADAVRANLDGDTAQEGVARIASGVLQRAALLFGDGRYIHSGANKPQLLLARKLFDPGRVLASLGATKAVIQMRDDDLIRSIKAPWARNASSAPTRQSESAPPETATTTRAPGFHRP